MGDRPVLEARDVSFAYEADKPILESVQFRVRPRDMIAVEGPSGVGKTTLLEILGTMRQPDSGKVLIKGEEVYQGSLDDRARIRGQYIGFVFQEALLLPDLTVWENCRMAAVLSNKNLDLTAVRDHYRELMETLQLDPNRGDERPSQFSTGERQRIAVVRSLISNPELLIADEPTGNLDQNSSDRLMDLLLPLARDKDVGILVATHDRDLSQSLDTRYLMEGRKLIKQDDDQSVSEEMERS
ncbi:MAG: ABC transporter ATP-binding protein [bacterium]